MNVSILFGYLVAIAIPIFAIYLIYALDLFGTGKLTTVLTSLAWGAVGAFTLAYFANNGIQRLLISAMGVENGRTAFSLVTSIIGPIVEETLKGLVLIYLIRQPRFRYIVDGAVYGFAAGIGFSVAENLFYLNGYGSLGLVIARVLSASLMHATASALVGISLGRLRRARDRQRVLLPFIGILLAIIVHVGYNNVVNPESVLNKLTNSTGLQGTALLLVAIGFGIGGGVLIGYLINQGLREEKQRFSETLSLGDKVSSGERRAVQGLGGDAIEQILKELGEDFGPDKIDKIRRLLVIQANIGILRNNLSSPVSPRLRKAWEDEIAALRKETDDIRADLGLYVMSFLRGVFPAEDEVMSNAVKRELGKSEVAQVHTFDMFISASRAAGTVSADQLERIGGLLSKIQIFKDVALADLENLSRAITERTFRDGELIFKRGDEGDAMYLIEEGGIDVFEPVPDGKEKLLRQCAAGDFVGELALLDGQPRSASARASGQLRVLVLRREQFLMFIRSRANVIIALLKFLAQRVRNSTLIIETSISWATHVAEGNYTQARAIAMMPGSQAIAAAVAASMPASPMGGNTQQMIAPIASLRAGNDSTAGVSDAAPVALSGAFARMAATLEKREDTLRTKMVGEGATPLDISELPEIEQRVMFAILRSPLANAEGLTVDALHNLVRNVPDMVGILTALTSNGWLLAAGHGTGMRYKPNLKRRRGRTTVGVE